MNENNDNPFLNIERFGSSRSFNISRRLFWFQRFFLWIFLGLVVTQTQPPRTEDR